MSDPTSIFGNPDSVATPPVNGDVGNVTSAPIVDPVADLLGSIKNERGEQKYKNLQDALGALRHSQNYIPELTNKLAERENELNTARADAARVAELERAVAALTQSSEVPTPPQGQGFSEELVAEMVNRSLTRKQTEDTQKSNVGLVVKDMIKQYGEDAQKTYEAKAAELGMTVAQLNGLAASTPQAVLKLMGVEPSKSKDQQPATQYNSEAFQPRQDTFIGKNPKPVLIGATSQDLKEESVRAKQMVEELHRDGKTVYDLTDPKVYFKYFK